MAKIYFDGIDEYAKRLGNLWKSERGIIENAVYEGAKVVADEIKEGLKQLPVEEGENGLPPMGSKENPLKGVSRKQKADLIDGFGLAPMEEDDGYINTKAGFDGYGSIKTKAYPKGQPLPMLMRSIESGTSFRDKHPVIRPAVNRARKKSKEAMQNKIEEELNKIFQ